MVPGSEFIARCLKLLTWNYELYLHFTNLNGALTAPLFFYNLRAVLYRCHKGTTEDYKKE